MVKRAIRVPNPYHVPFDIWVGVVCKELSVYNVPVKPTEAKWKDWALQVVRNTQALKLQGLPDPRTFPNWRTWGARVHEALLQVR